MHTALLDYSTGPHPPSLYNSNSAREEKQLPHLTEKHLVGGSGASAREMEA